MTNYLGKFAEDINHFNRMYSMPRYDKFRDVRLVQFVNILQEEVDEHADITDLVGLCDWLGDIMIYCASELVRHRVDPGDILALIMHSNFSKLGDDGQPIYDERGKLKKGPNYKPPEFYIQKILDRKYNHLVAGSTYGAGNKDGEVGSPAGREQEVTGPGVTAEEASSHNGTRDVTPAGDLAGGYFRGSGPT